MGPHTWRPAHSFDRSSSFLPLYFRRVYQFASTVVHWPYRTHVGCSSVKGERGVGEVVKSSRVRLLVYFSCSRKTGTPPPTRKKIHWRRYQVLAHKINASSTARYKTRCPLHSLPRHRSLNEIQRVHGQKGLKLFTWSTNQPQNGFLSEASSHSLSPTMTSLNTTGVVNLKI